MRDFIESLIGLDHTVLFDRAREVRLQNALSEWQMAAMLMAIERQRAYLECDCSSITVYAEKKLGLHPKKTRAMLRLARVAERFELASKAFRDGSLCWTKLREIGRVLDEHNEAKWVKYATTHTVRQVEKAVAKPPASLRKPTSRLEYPTLFDIPACPASGHAGAQERVILMPCPDQPAENDADESPDLPARNQADDDYVDDPHTEEEYELMAEEYFAQQRALKPWLYEKRPLPDWIKSDPADDDKQPEEEPPPTRLIRMTFVFKPDEYAVVEAALRKAHSQMRRRQTQSEQLVEISKQFLASGSDCTKARYPVVIQIEGHDAVYVTDRGDLAVPADKLRGLLSQARPPRKRPQRRALRTATTAPINDVASKPADEQTRLGQAPENTSTIPQTAMPDIATEQPTGHASHVGHPQVDTSPTPQTAEQPTGHASHVGQPGLNECATQVLELNNAEQPADEIAQVYRLEPSAATAPTARKGKRRTASRPNAIREVLARSGWACVDCGSRDRLEIDHKVPICRGGSDDAEDQDPRCHDCHKARHRDDFEQDPIFQAGRRHARMRRQRQPPGSPEAGGHSQEETDGS